MKALVLDGAGSQKTAKSIEEASRKAGFETDTVDLGRASLRGCQSCLNCWLKTPGECAVKDDAVPIVKKWAGSDLIIFVTPALLGTYSPALKRALERMLPLALPYFKKMDGKVRHPLRYEGRPGLLVFGMAATEAENRHLQDLVAKNTVILRPRFHETVILDGNGDGAKISSAFENARKVMA
jgi:multimeric flavodoxin WrbA